MAIPFISLRAADRDWIDPLGGTFSTASNWENSILPVAADRAIFNVAAAYIVSFNSNPTNSRLRISRDTVTFNLLTRNYTLTSASPISLSIGGSALQSHTGHLTVQGGTLTTNGTEIGGGSAMFPNLGSGRLTVSTGATWNDSGVVAVGAFTTGTLEVQSGGDAQSLFAQIGAGRTGTATVSGAGSTWTVTNSLDVGAASTGTFNIMNGALVTVSDDTFIGAGTGINGTVNISGAQARLVVGPVFTVGEFGNGSLAISAGGSVSSPAGSDNRIGNQSSSSGTVTLTGGSWPNLGSLTVGNFGSATMQINATSTVLVGGDTFIAKTGLSTATISLAGNAAQLFENGAGGIYVGGGTSAAGGIGSLNIGPGAKVTASPLKIWNTGNLTLSGGTLVTGDFAFAPGTFDWLFGRLEFAAHTLQAGSPFGATLNLTMGQILYVSSLIVGGSLSADLTVHQGAMLISDGAFLGDSSVGDGAVTVDGPAALWHSGGIVVGNNGTGDLTISNGGRLETFPIVLLPDMAPVQSIIARHPGSTGNVIIDGVGSFWTLGAFPSPGDLIIGREGDGFIEIRNGGIMVSYYSGAFLGSMPNSRGEVIIRGNGSQWRVDTYPVYVGYEGTASISVLEGGKLDMSVAGFPSHLIIAQLNDAEVIVDGPGSTLIGQTTVGGDADGTLTVSNGGFLMTDSLVSAKFPTGTATITVDGAGTSLVCDGNFGEFIIGGAGIATAQISAGAQVQCLEAIIADGTGSKGTVEVTGGGSQLFAAEEIDVGRKDQGTLIVSDAGAVVSPFIFVTAFGVLAGDGLVIGDVFNSGLVSPGLSPGTLSIVGDYVQESTGTLAIDLDGPPDAPVYDQLQVSATVELDGTLDVKLAAGFTPLPGTEFEILSAMAVSGDFATKLGTAEFLYFVEPTRIFLRACHNRPLADFDCTGGLGLSDHQETVDCLSGPDVPYPNPSCSLADFNGDGDVDLADVARFQAAFAAN